MSTKMPLFILYKISLLPPQKLFVLRFKKKSHILKKHLLKIILIQDPSFPLFTVLNEVHLHIPEKLSTLHC